MEHVVRISDSVYRQLERSARDAGRTPDQLADEILRTHLTVSQPHVEIVRRTGGPQAVIKGTRIAVSDIVAYLRLGETPESLANEVLPQLTLAEIHDALQYYDEHREEIDAILQENNEAVGRAYLRSRLDEEDYRQITGQRR